MEHTLKCNAMKPCFPVKSYFECELEEKTAKVSYKGARKVTLSLAWKKEWCYWVLKNVSPRGKMHQECRYNYYTLKMKHQKICKISLGSIQGLSSPISLRVVSLRILQDFQSDLLALIAKKIIFHFHNTGSPLIFPIECINKRQWENDLS